MRHRVSILWGALLALGMISAQAAGVQPQVLASGFSFPEGPVLMPDGGVVFVEILGDKLTRIAVDGSTSTWVEVGPGPNGAAIGPDGALYVLTNGGKPGNTNGGSVVRIDPKTRASKVLYTSVDGERLKGPNDIVFDEWGDFWFTDFAGGALYNARIDGSRITRIATIPGANGIGLSPDHRTLYVAQVQQRQVAKLQVIGRGQVQQKDGAADVQVLAKLEDSLDSLKVDAKGDVLVASGEAGITSVAPDGRVLGKTSVLGKRVTNLVFTGKDLKTLYVTANDQGTSGSLIAVPWPDAGLKLLY
ncbi:MAG: SMP-30/gluconolactonase/LRE family protein [Steroidobacteraceae bacterium]